MTKKLPSLDITRVLPVTELPVLSAVEQMGRDMMKGGDDEGSDTPPLEYYGEWFMENMSEAGYTETRREDRLSSRAFANVVRYQKDELKTVQDALGYDGCEYREFALCSTLIDAISRSESLAPALSFLKPADNAKPQGPFYPTRKVFDLRSAVEFVATNQFSIGVRTTDQRVASYLTKLVKTHKKPSGAIVAPSPVDAAVVRLAGMFRISQDDLTATAKKLVAAGADNQQLLTVSMAYLVLEAVRSTARFVTGLNWAQPKRND